MSAHRYRSLVGAAAAIGATAAVTLFGGAGFASASEAPHPLKCVEYPSGNTKGIKCIWQNHADCEKWRQGLLAQGWIETWAQCQHIPKNQEITQWEHPAGHLGGAIRR